MTKKTTKEVSCHLEPGAAEMFIPMTGSAADLAHTQAASGSVSGVEGDDTIELRTSAPRVELERDNERKKRCVGCESLTYSLLVPGCKTLIPVCRKMSCKLCVDICDEDCPLVKATVDKLDAALEEQVYCGGNLPHGMPMPSKPIYGATRTQEAKAHLTALQTKLLELKSNQEYMLREEYGVRWHQMTGTIAGSGYEVCEELLEMINGMMGES